MPGAGSGGGSKQANLGLYRSGRVTAAIAEQFGGAAFERPRENRRRQRPWCEVSAKNRGKAVSPRAIGLVLAQTRRRGGARVRIPPGR